MKKGKLTALEAKCLFLGALCYNFTFKKGNIQYKKHHNQYSSRSRTQAKHAEYRGLETAGRCLA